MDGTLIEAENSIDLLRVRFWNTTIIIACMVLFLLAFIIPQEVTIGPFNIDYAPVHTVLEFLAIIPAFAIFTLGLATSRSVQAKYIVVLSFAGLTAGILDIGHVLSYKGMADFITASGPDKAIYYWFASRVALGGAIAYISIFLIDRGKEESLKPFKACCGLALTFLYVGVSSYFILFNPSKLPPMYIDGVGLSDLKIGIELSIAIVAFITSFIFLGKLKSQRTDEYTGTKWLAYGCFIFGLSGLCFISYTGVDDRFNFLGHVLKIIAMGYLYFAVFLECVINPLKRMQNLAVKAESAEKSKTKFLANVSHELRTPLGIISGYSEMLANKTGEFEGKQWVSVIRQNSEQLRFLIDDLLDMVKVDSEDFNLTYSQFSLKDFLAQCRDDFETEFQRKGISLIIDNQTEDNYFVVTDKYRLRQVFNNILSNAKKFTDSGHVKIEASNAGDLIKIKISDTGRGIERVYRENLFKPFNQLHDLERCNAGGTGLGLALSRKLSQLLGGDLYLEKTKVGKGSTFTFTFQNEDLAKVNKPQETKNMLENNQDKQYSGKKVLIVDDVQENLNLLELYLDSSKADVSKASSGDEAINKLKKEPFDLVFLDIQMPQKDGYTTAREIREMGIETPIVAISAHVHESERKKAFDSGFQDYLYKPIEVDKLYDGLARHL